MEDLVLGWINAQGIDSESEEYGNVCWAIDQLYNLAYDDPNKLLEVVSKILAKNSSEQVVGALGSGVLEDLLVHHGDEVIGKIVEISESDINFKRCLTYTYIDHNDVSADVFKTFQATKKAPMRSE